MAWCLPALPIAQVDAPALLLKQGQTAALLQPIERDLETYARRLIWEPADAPDALQNAVMRGFAALDRSHEDASYRAWKFKILTVSFRENRTELRSSCSV